MKLDKIENGMEKAAESIDKNFQMLNYEDSGWIKLTVENAKNTDMYIRKRNNEVRVLGNMSLSVTSTPKKLFSVPDGFELFKETFVNLQSTMLSNCSLQVVNGKHWFLLQNTDPNGQYGVNFSYFI